MKKTVFFGLFVLLLVLGFVACDTGNSNSNDDSDGDEEFTITFDLDGGDISGNSTSVNIKVKSGETISTLPSPQKVGNDFDGWFTQKNGLGTQFTTSSIVSSNLSVYAKWTIKQNGDPIINYIQGGPFRGVFTIPNVIDYNDFIINKDSIIGTGLSITNVSTNGGGNTNYETGEGGSANCSWVFIYEGDNKIGIAIYFIDYGEPSYAFGKSTMSTVDGFLSGWIGELPEIEDMTNEYVGHINK